MNPMFPGMQLSIFAIVFAIVLFFAITDAIARWLGIHQFYIIALVIGIIAIYFNHFPLR